MVELNRTDRTDSFCSSNRRKKEIRSKLKQHAEAHAEFGDKKKLTVVMLPKIMTSNVITSVAHNGSNMI